MKSDLDYLTDEELEETYRREVMTYQIEEVRRQKRGKKIYRLTILLGIAAIILFFLFGGIGTNTVGMY